MGAVPQPLAWAARWRPLAGERTERPQRDPRPAATATGDRATPGSWLVNTPQRRRVAVDRATRAECGALPLLWFGVAFPAHAVPPGSLMARGVIRPRDVPRQTGGGSLARTCQGSSYPLYVQLRRDCDTPIATLARSGIGTTNASQCRRRWVMGRSIEHRPRKLATFGHIGGSAAERCAACRQQCVLRVPNCYSPHAGPAGHSAARPRPRDGRPPSRATPTAPWHPNATADSALAGRCLSSGSAHRSEPERRRRRRRAPRCG